MLNLFFNFLKNRRSDFYKIFRKRNIHVLVYIQFFWKRFMNKHSHGNFSNFLTWKYSHHLKITTPFYSLQHNCSISIIRIRIKIKTPIFFYSREEKWSQDLGNDWSNGKRRFHPHSAAHNSPIARWDGNNVRPSNAGRRRVCRISLRIYKWHGMCAGQSAWRTALPTNMGQHSMLATHKGRILRICALHVGIQRNQVWHFL